jgi:hypothetical protein
MALESDDKVALGHAERMWQAERENAERLASRVRFVVPLVSTLLGLVIAGMFKADLWGVLEPIPGYWRWLAGAGVVVPLVVGLAFLVVSLKLLLFHVAGPAGSGSSPEGLQPLPQASSTPVSDGSADERRLFASFQLLLTPRGIYAVERALRHSPVHWRVFRETYSAAVDLLAKNAQERVRIRTSERWLAVGFFSIVAAVSIYTVVSVVSAVRSGGPSDGRQATTS